MCVSKNKFRHHNLIVQSFVCDKPSSIYACGMCVAHKHFGSSPSHEITSDPTKQNENQWSYKNR